LLFAIAMPLNASASLEALRVGAQPDNAVRIVLEAAKPVAYNAFYLSGPDRIVIDFLDTPSKLKSKYSGIGRLSEVSTTSKMSDHPRITRIVARVNQPMKISRDFTLKPAANIPNHRIVFDLVPSNRAEFDRLSGTKTRHSSNDFRYDYTALERAVERAIEEEIVYDSARSQQPARPAATTTRPEAPRPAPTVPVERQNVALRGAKVIVIDPGHGGRDPGTIGRRGTREKDVVLQIGRELRTILAMNPRFRVLMTRDDDTFISLSERARFAERHHADLFISIHADHSPRREAQGFSIYTLNARATDEEAARLAEKENAADLIGIDTFGNYDRAVKSILSELMQTQVNIASVDIASEIVMQMRAERGISLLMPNPHKGAPFTVLRSTVPSVLAEVGFLSNDKEEALLRTPSHRTRIATALARAIENALRD